MFLFSDLDSEHSVVLQLSFQSLFLLFQHISLFLLFPYAKSSRLPLSAASFQRIQTHRHLQQFLTESLKCYCLKNSFSFKNVFTQPQWGTTAWICTWLERNILVSSMFFCCTQVSLCRSTSSLLFHSSSSSRSSALLWSSRSSSFSSQQLPYSCTG